MLFMFLFSDNTSINVTKSNHLKERKSPIILCKHRPLKIEINYSIERLN